MTKREIASLESICGRLEQLQINTKDREAKAIIGKAKHELLRVLAVQS